MTRLRLALCLDSLNKKLIQTTQKILLPNDEIYLLNVRDKISIPYDMAQSIAAETVEALEKKLIKDQDELLSMAAADFKDQKVNFALKKVVQCKLDSEKFGLQQQIDDLNPDFVLVGSHGYGPLKGVKSVIMGSISQHILHHSFCPVIIVKV